MEQALSNQNCTCRYKLNIHRSNVSVMISWPEIVVPLNQKRLDRDPHPYPVRRLLCISSCKLFVYLRLEAFKCCCCVHHPLPPLSVSMASVRGAICIRPWVFICCCNPVLVPTFTEWLSGTEPWPRTTGAVHLFSLCL